MSTSSDLSAQLSTTQVTAEQCAQFAPDPVAALEAHLATPEGQANLKAALDEGDAVARKIREDGAKPHVHPMDASGKRDRHLYLLKSEQQVLDVWCSAIWKVFGEPPYLVGSCLRRPDYRDVDIRVILEDQQVAAIHKLMHISQVNLAFSIYGQKMTGLPIDFQIQSESEAAKNEGERNPRGIIREKIEPSDLTADALVEKFFPSA